MKGKTSIIVIINGFPGAGKDTFVACCGMVVKEGVYNLHTSQPVKDALFSLGWKNEKTPEIRDLLAYLRKESDSFFDTSFQYITSKVRQFGLAENFKPIIFIHCREPINIKRYVDSYKRVTTLLISRQRGESETFEPLSTNDSDRDVNLYQYDKVIQNDGSVQELYAKAKEYVEELLCGQN